MISVTVIAGLTDVSGPAPTSRSLGASEDYTKIASYAPVVFKVEI